MKATSLFQRLTEPPPRLARTSLMLSLDSHAVPCWTRKYAVPKGYHTCRNKHMKIEHLYYFYDMEGNCLLRLVATPGDRELHRLMLPEVRRLMKDTGAVRVRVVMDAAADREDNALLALMHEPGVEVLARAVRRPKRMEKWRAIPEGEWATFDEPNETAGLPPNVIEVANTVTRIGSTREPVRTVVARERHGRDRKECYHVLYTNIARERAISLVREFRRRQDHEQAYRVGVHDLNLDAITHGYVKDSNPMDPGFDAARVTLVGWVKALAFNAFREFAQALPGKFSKMQAGSLMRRFILRPGSLYATADELIVALDPFGDRDALAAYVERLNAGGHRIPWLGNRRLRITFAPPEAGISGGAQASILTPKDSWC